VGFVLAAILDFLIVVFAALPFANYRTPVLIGEIVLIALYRQLLGRTPGQQIVGVRSTTIGRQFARALLGLVLILYLGLTFSAGALISTLTDAKIDGARVNLRPILSGAPAHSPVPGIMEHFPNVTFQVPRTAAGHAIEPTSCCVLYGAVPSDDVVDPGILIFAQQNLHPYDYCQGVRNPAAVWLSGCRTDPLTFQQNVASATTSDRLKMWNPIAVVRTNFALVAKSSYLEDVTPSYGIRRFLRGDAEVLWLRGTRTMKKKSEEARVELDRFLIASRNEFVGVDIVWKKVPRDASLAELVASTIALEKPSLAAIDAELNAPDERIVHLTNAFRMSGKRPDVAQRLRDALRDGGTDRQRRYLELTLEK